MDALIVDANVLFSALYDPASSCGSIVMLGLEGELTLLAPETVRAEMLRALEKNLGYGKAEAEAAVASLPVEWMEAATYAARMAEARALVRDASDAPLVALALASGHDIVSGDKDLHALKPAAVKVWRPKDAGGRSRRR